MVLRVCVRPVSSIIASSTGALLSVQRRRSLPGPTPFAFSLAGGPAIAVRAGSGIVACQRMGGQAAYQAHRSGPSRSIRTCPPGARRRSSPLRRCLSPLRRLGHQSIAEEEGLESRSSIQGRCAVCHLEEQGGTGQPNDRGPDQHHVLPASDSFSLSNATLSRNHCKSVFAAVKPLFLLLQCVFSSRPRDGSGDRRTSGTAFFCARPARNPLSRLQGGVGYFVSARPPPWPFQTFFRNNPAKLTTR